MRLMNLMACTTAALLGLSGNALACPTDSSTSTATLRTSPLPPPPVTVTLTGELINMTDFAPPEADAWKLVRPNRQIRLDITQVQGRVKRFWNSRVTIEGFWRGAAGSPDRVFIVTRLQRA